MTQKHVELCHSQEQTGKKLGEQEKGRGYPVTHALEVKRTGVSLVPRVNSQAHECPSAEREGFPLAWSPREAALKSTSVQQIEWRRGRGYQLCLGLYQFGWRHREGREIYGTQDWAFL